MKHLFLSSLALLLILLFSVRSAIGGTVCTTSCNQDGTGGSTVTDYNIFVDGSLFLDYSVLTDTQSLVTGGGITLSANTISIFSYDQVPTMPDPTSVTIFPNPLLSMNEVGNILIFSDTPITSGTFEATNAIYVGNYSSLAPVPVPPAIILFISGLIALWLLTSANKTLVRGAAARCGMCPAVHR